MLQVQQKPQVTNAAVWKRHDEHKMH